MRNLVVAVLLGLLLLVASGAALAKQSPSQLRTYTVEDDIRTASFGDPFTGKLDPFTVSPDGKFVAVDIERGLPDRDRVEDELRVGEGLQQWFRHSPEFNLDKVSTPLRIVDRGRWGLLVDWEPYAMLRILHKPVDFIQLNATQHPTTRPAARLVSQGGSVDWFRFWLQGYEDPDPAKREQYARWHKLRALHEADLKAMHDQQPVVTAVQH